MLPTTKHPIKGKKENAECFKKSFTTVFKILLYDECYENVYT
jgi:hypothetical protein